MAWDVFPGVSEQRLQSRSALCACCYFKCCSAQGNRKETATAAYCSPSLLKKIHCSRPAQTDDYFGKLMLVETRDVWHSMSTSRVSFGYLRSSYHVCFHRLYDCISFAYISNWFQTCQFEISIDDINNTITFMFILGSQWFNNWIV